MTIEEKRTHRIVNRKTSEKLTGVLTELGKYTFTFQIAGSTNHPIFVRDDWSIESEDALPQKTGLYVSRAIWEKRLESTWIGLYLRDTSGHWYSDESGDWHRTDVDSLPTDLIELGTREDFA